MAYVFGYGSLVDRGSLEASVGRPVEPVDGPFPARLRGYRRCWNVVTPSSMRPDYVLTTVDGEPWQGPLGWLGIEPDPAASALGAAYRVTGQDLDVLDRRELSYDRVDVTAQLDRQWVGGPVFTYRPRVDAVGRARAAGDTAVVFARYLRLLERGFRALGDDLYDEHVRTLPDPAPFRVREITAVPRDPAVRNIAVDPARE